MADENSSRSEGPSVDSVIPPSAAPASEPAPRGPRIAGGPVQDIAPPRSTQPRQGQGRRSRSRWERTAGAAGTTYRTSLDAYASAQALARLRTTLVRTLGNARDEHVRDFSETSLAAAREITKPSLWRYVPYISACILMDIWGAVISALNLSGAALVVTVIANIILMVFLWAFGRILLGKRLKRAKKKRKELEGRVNQTRNDIRLLSQQAQRFRRYARGVIRRSPKMAARATSITRRIVRLTKFKAVGRVVSWFTRLAAWAPFKYIAEAIPFLQALPWWTIGAVAIYVEHRGEYKDAQRTLTEFQELKGDYIGLADDFSAIQVGTVDAELENAVVQAQTDEIPASA